MTFRTFVFNLFSQILLIIFILHFTAIYCYFSLLQLNLTYIFEIFIPFLIILFIILGFVNENPINTLFFILGAFILISLLLFYFAIEFLTYIFLIVYLGALLMLFLFVLMLFNLQQTRQFWKLQKFQNIIISIIILNFLIYIITNLIYKSFSESLNLQSVLITFTSSFYQANFTLNGISSFASLYNTDHFVFLFLTILLFFTMIGAITLALTTKVKTW